jgi:hypothetical protein
MPSVLRAGDAGRNTTGRGRARFVKEYNSIHICAC